MPDDTAALQFPITWSGSDEVGQIASYSLFVSAAGGPFVPLSVDTTETSVSFEGGLGVVYGFECVAEDTAGNFEQQTFTAEAMTRACIDADADGTCVLEDCDDDDPSAVSSPGEIGTVLFVTRDLVEWGLDPSGSGTVYDVIRGELSDLPVEPGPFQICVSENLPSTEFMLLETPGPGQGFYLLVRGQNPCGTGGLGFSTGGSERSTLACS